ncbi:MAG: zf-TFIIB domain-containing protein [Armatimonadota bacterium]|nr:zf-TFIIB domain-containing protein [bacterium]
MNCPVCDGRLRAVEKHGVEVDICPECKGVWLDRGELEKIIEMANAGGPAQSHDPEIDRKRYGEDHCNPQSDRYNERDRNFDSRTSHSKRRGSWISDIFESFGSD